ncbi:hypothetical protein KP696_15200 [Nocardia seriolae]|nr:hypothetical protein [Nocardia seriolae]MTJ60124.1 hypothetical protein [Nocardia seriolae]MTJ76254.1 hypothetical protein [Nocardia seriolae]MTJ85123.1 hypothetical protein [Nocardia seriolae]MTK29117.1 hypothetical protein [Nocardia seriolae]MTK38055.1 hypothetical protein [Nocardia seriolae]
MSGIEPNDLYLDVPALRELATLLDGVPELAEDLEDSVSGRARLGAANTRLSGRSSDQPLPFSVGAAKVRDHLHATLVSWVRLICEQRALDYTGDTSTAGLARWLHRNLIALAMTEGAEGAPAEIRMAVAAAERVVCPPAVEYTIDAMAIEAARRARLNSSGIAILAKELGEPFRAITVRRIQTLRDAGRVAPVPGPWAADWPEQFVVGEVFDAHLAHPMRRRKYPTRSRGRRTRSSTLGSAASVVPEGCE